MRRIRFLLVIELVFFVFWGFVSKIDVLARVCTSADNYCNGSYAVKCKSDGSGFFSSYCTYGCSGGSCIAAPVICTAGSTRCSGSDVQRCSNNGTSWYVIDNCNYGCLRGSCLSPPPTATPVRICTPYSTRCSTGSMIELCNSSGTEWHVIGSCQYGCFSGSCLPASSSCSSSNCSGCTSASPCSSAGCYWEVLLGVCTNSILTPTPTSPLPSGSSGLSCPEMGGDCVSSEGLCTDYGGEVVWRTIPYFWSGLECSVNTYCCVVQGSVDECNDDIGCGSDIDGCNYCKNPDFNFSTCDTRRVTGSCGTGAFSCKVGSASNTNTISDSDGITYTWYCGGSGECFTSSGQCSTSCSAMDGVCGNTRGTCSSGDVAGLTDEFVSAVPGETGKISTWDCNGSCNGGSQSCGGEAFPVCNNGNVVNGACKSVASQADVDAHTLCMGGTEANVTVTESQITWDCLGSTNTCAEGDGADALNCHSDVDQINWFQVNDGNVLAKGKVNNYVPITTRVGGSTNLTSTVVNGKVYSRLASSLSDYDQSVVDKNENSSFNFKTYNYSQIKTDYFDKKGIGTVFTANDGWSTIKETTGIIFVDGDLIIDSNLVTTNFVMIIAKGTITIEPTVTRIDAILLGNRVIAAAADDSVESVTQLVINGMVHGVTSVEFSRSLVPKSGNNTSPSVVVNYKPELLFMVPEKLAKAFSQWKVN